MREATSSAWGVVLYELVTGRAPFSGSNFGETVDKILHAQPDGMARFNYDTPPEIERIVRKCHKELTLALAPGFPAALA